MQNKWFEAQSQPHTHHLQPFNAEKVTVSCALNCNAIIGLRMQVDTCNC